VTAVTDTNATVEELLEAVFSVGSVQRPYKKTVVMSLKRLGARTN
jgi:hypothetical protein